MRNRFRHFLTAAALLLGSLTTLAAEEGDQGLSFKLYAGHLIVAKGRIGELNRLNFLIDTGTYPTLIDRKVAKKLKIEGKSQQYGFFGRKVRVQETLLPSLQIGPIQRESLPVLVRDLSPLSRSLGLRIDAQIGLDVLGPSCRIDYQAKRIRFDTAGPLESSVRFEPGHPFIVVPLEIEGQVIRLLLDTGADHTVLFQSRVQGLLPKSRVKGERAFLTAAGQSQLKRVELPQIRLGEQELGRQTAYLLEATAHPSMPYDGLLAMTSLGVERIQYDFGRHLLSWER